MASSPSRTLSSNFDSTNETLSSDMFASTTPQQPAHPEIVVRVRKAKAAFPPTLNYRTSYDLPLYCSPFSIVLRSTDAVSRSLRSPKIGSWGTAFPRIKIEVCGPTLLPPRKMGQFRTWNCTALSFTMSVTRSKGNPRVWRGGSVLLRLNCSISTSLRFTDSPSQEGNSIQPNLHRWRKVDARHWFNGTGFFE
jgi:hypothetical protein